KLGRVDLDVARRWSDRRLGRGIVAEKRHARPGHPARSRRRFRRGAILTARDHTITLNGLRFHFLDWGSEGRSPLLLIHGGAQTAHSWDEVAPELAADHHVLAIDQRGHGDTEWARDGRYRREDFIADIRAF